MNASDASFPRLIAARRTFLYGLGAAAVSGCAARNSVVPPFGSPRNPECGVPVQSGGRRTEGARHVECGGGLGSDLSGLTISQIKALSTAQVQGLTGSQLGTLTPPQIPVFTSTQVTAFGGPQASAIFDCGMRAQQGSPPAPPTRPNPPPPPYTPSHPDDQFWPWIGGIVGGVVGGAVGGLTGNPIVVFIGSQAGGALGSVYMNGGTGAYFNFWNPNTNGGTGGWQSVGVSLNPSQQLDSGGYTVQGNFDSNSNTVTITVIAN